MQPSKDTTWPSPSKQTDARTFGTGGQERGRATKLVVGRKLSVPPLQTHMLCGHPQDLYHSVTGDPKQAHAILLAKNTFGSR